MYVNIGVGIVMVRDIDIGRYIYDIWGIIGRMYIKLILRFILGMGMWVWG